LLERLRRLSLHQTLDFVASAPDLYVVFELAGKFGAASSVLASLVVMAAS
jgi:hypothetical protein